MSTDDFSYYQKNDMYENAYIYIICNISNI